MARRKAETKQDLSSFMAILIMTIGALVVLLVSNTLIIISNPNNTAITSVVTFSLTGDESDDGMGSPFPRGNIVKEPSYIDVHRDRLVLYPGGIVVPVRDLERSDNPLNTFLDRIRQNRNAEYVVLLVRPRAATVSRRLAKAARDRDIDLGFELFEANRDVDYERRYLATMGML
jgi:hypothetical protein